MPAATLPKKRVFGEASSARRNIVATPVSAKKRRLDEPSSSPAPRLTSSQNDGKGKLASSQPKSAFESEVLERMSQDISDLKQNNAEKDQVWDRPPVPRDYNPDTDSLCFQAIEAEEGTVAGGQTAVKLFGVTSHGNSVQEGTVAGGQTAVKLFGVTSHGNSVLLHVKDFKHYLYVAAPVSFTAEDCPKYRAYLETQVAMHQTAIDSVTMTMRENIYGFQGNIQNPYLKITVTDPKLINKVRTTIETGKANWKGMWKSADGTVMTYDNIQYLLRFMVDCSVCFLV
jgi:DNA polymerase delta subunit 1